MIPTDDPAAALEFCRSLQALLKGTDATPVPPELSVVLPVFNEVSNLAPLFERLCKTLEVLVPGSFELVFVDDGSSDGSAEYLTDLAARHPYVVALLLSRNFGHQAAVTAGLDHSRGRAAVIMDSDLQDEPEVIPALFEQWKAGYEVVYAVRRSRAEHGLLRACYKLFYRLLKSLAHIDIPVDAGDFSLLDRRAIHAMCSLRERHPFLRGIRSWVGFRQIGVPVDRSARNSGKSKYSLRALMELALDGLVGFSLIPLRCIAWAGGVLSLASVLLAGFYFIKRLSVGLYPPGFATLTVLVCFLAGIQLLTLGIMSEYLGRVLDEVKARPRYVVAKRINWFTSESPPAQ
jgi:dolichol-phosphate mannosyltransferase